MFSWGFVSEGSSHLDQNGFDETLNDEQTISRKASFALQTNGSPPTMLNDDTILDFVPHVVRVSKPLLKRVIFASITYKNITNTPLIPCDFPLEGHVSLNKWLSLPKDLNLPVEWQRCVRLYFKDHLWRCFLEGDV